MKAQVEAAKEEKRRKEALAARKAQHMEATMRFQKGIKNFKMKKGFFVPISLIKNKSSRLCRKNIAGRRAEADEPGAQSPKLGGLGPLSAPAQRARRLLLREQAARGRRRQAQLFI